MLLSTEELEVLDILKIPASRNFWDMYSIIRF